MPASTAPMPPISMKPTARRRLVSAMAPSGASSSVRMAMATSTGSSRSRLAGSSTTSARSSA